MKVSLKLTQSIDEISQLINNAIYEQINKYIRKNLNKTKNNFKNSIRRWIESQPEIQSLQESGTQNTLAALFGLKQDEAQQATRSIVDAVTNSIEININFNNKLSGDIRFNFQPLDFSNLLSLLSGHRTTDKNTDLHWLDWLLTKGNTVIVVGYYYQPSNKGRSGGGTMIEKGSFRIPPAYAGNLNNNFITRAFQGKESEITKILQGLLD